MSFTHDAIVIGGGSGGLTAAGGLAMFGLRCALIEMAEMGGECLNTGCVPSKALIAAAARAQQGRVDRFGIAFAEPRVQWSGISEHIRQAIDAIAPHDSQERFEALGVEVIREFASFSGRRSIRAGQRRLSAPRIVIATGSKPTIPPINGLEGVPFLTNESLFALETLPEHLAIVGAGAVGMEMAQAFRRLGSQVTLINSGRVLKRDDEEAVRLVASSLRSEGVRFIAGSAARAFSDPGSIAIECDDGSRISASHLLIAAGRRANTGGLDLQAAGVQTGENGIVVDQRRRTSNKAIYAIGDCRDGPRFTHVAGYEGSNVALEIALGLPMRVNWSALPHCTFTDPELAQVGLTEAEARKMHGGSVRVVRENFDQNDRAVTEGASIGFCKIVLKGKKLLGATIVGSRAGELLLPYSLAISGTATTFALGSAIVAYPTRSEIAKATGFAAWEPTIFGALPKKWAGTLARVRRRLAWRSAG